MNRLERTDAQLSPAAEKGCTCGACRGERRRKLGDDPVPDDPIPDDEQQELGDYL